MALFGSPQAYIGIDIGTSSLKVVELLNRRQRLEVGTYAQANLPNLIVAPSAQPEENVRRVASVLVRMLEAAGVSADTAVAALPSSVVFSAVLQLPDVPDEAMDKAVHIAARDVVPADLSETMLGWSRVGELPHMEGTTPALSAAEAPAPPPNLNSSGTVPVFITAAPKDIVDRYVMLMELAQLNLAALEVETFPLARSLLSGPSDSAMIVDIGDTITTYHIIDAGAPRFSFSIDYGGHHITQAVADALKITGAEAEKMKIESGVKDTAPSSLRSVNRAGAQKMISQAQQLLDTYARRSQRRLNKTVLIGGGAGWKGLSELWSKTIGHPVSVGNPWKGLSYPVELESRLRELGPSYAVAVGLAQRELIKV